MNENKLTQEKVSRRPRVLILWAKHSATNLGIRALLTGIQSVCTEAWGDCDFLIHDHDTPNTPLGKSSILRDVGRRNGFIKALARTVDYVVDTGSGDSFTDIYGIRRLTVMAYNQHAVRRSGTPLILAPQTVGPFQSRVGKFLGKQNVRKASTLFVRDSASRDYVSSLGREAEYVSSDLVFAIPRPIPGRSRDIVLNVSGLLWNENPHVPSEKYRSAILEFCRAVQDEGREVSLLAHVLESPRRENDVTAAKDAGVRLGGNIEVIVPSSLEDVRSQLAGASVLIGARMHACLNSISVGTPAIPWAYSRKFRPLLEDIGWPYHVDLRTSNDIAAETTELLIPACASRQLAEKAACDGRASLAGVSDYLRNHYAVVSR